MRVILILFILKNIFGSENIAYDKNNNKNCQSFGFYYKNDGEENINGNETCYLCFCTQKGTNICWQADNSKCTNNNNINDNKKNIRYRAKRSPAGLADLFMQGAANDFLNNNPKPVCTPFQSSYSDGCPPDDWCTGCTVCDCNPAGQWDCHLLSYCGKNEKKRKRLDDKVRRKSNKNNKNHKVKQNENPKTEATATKNKEKEKLKDTKPSLRQAELNLRKAKKESELKQMLKGVKMKRYTNATLADKTMKNMKRSLRFFKAVEKIGDTDNNNAELNDTNEKSISKIIIKRYNINNVYVTVKPPTILVKDVKIVNNNVTTIEKRRIKKVYAYVPNKAMGSEM